MCEEKSELKGMLFGLLIGTAFGTALGILLAPAEGSETRRKLRNTLEDFSDKTKGTTARVKDFIRRKKEEIEEEQETAA